MNGRAVYVTTNIRTNSRERTIGHGLSAREQVDMPSPQTKAIASRMGMASAERSTKYCQIDPLSLANLKTTSVDEVKSVDSSTSTMPSANRSRWACSCVAAVAIPGFSIRSP